MQKLLIIMLSLFSLNVLANTCEPIIDSKKYLTNNFKAPYPKFVKYECTYKCKSKNIIENVTAISTVQVTSLEDDMKLVVCQGIKLKETSWGFDFDKIEAFYPFDTKLIEIKSWAFETIDPNNSTEKIYLQELKKKLLTVSGSYKAVSLQSFQEAGMELEAIARELPQKTQLLDEHIQEILINKGKISYRGDKKSLIQQMILTHANWRVPTHLF